MSPRFRTGLRSVFVTDTTVAREADSGPVASILTLVSVTLPLVEPLPVLQDEPPLRADAARNRDKVIAAAEGRLDRYRTGPFTVYRAHVALLVHEAAPDADWEYLTDTLLAALTATHVSYMRRVRGMSDERLAAGWAELVRRLFS